MMAAKRLKVGHSKKQSVLLANRDRCSATIYELSQVKSRLCQCSDAEAFASLKEDFYEDVESFVEPLLAMDFTEDDTRRRIIMCIVERLLQLELELFLFQKIPWRRTLNAIRSHLLSKSNKEIGFVHDFLHFGGVWKMAPIGLLTIENNSLNDLDLDYSRDNIRNNSVQFISVLFILVAFLDKTMDEATEITTDYEDKLFELVDVLFSSSTVLFIDSLIEQDERCLTCLLCILRISMRRKLPDFLDPIVMFIILVKKINFDPLVVLDWFCSETVSYALFYRLFARILHLFDSSDGSLKFLEQSCQRLEVDNINCRRRKFKIASNDEKPDERSEYLEAATVSTPKDQIETLSQPETFEFEVVERHGEMEVPKKYSIPLMSNATLHSQGTGDVEMEGDSRELMRLVANFFTELRIKLEECAGSLPCSVSPIVTKLKRIEALTIEFEF